MELIIILVIVVVIFGAGRLSGIGGALGKGIRDFRTATKDDDANKAQLVSTCTSCGTEMAPTENFCGKCGTKRAAVAA
jgi:sec-independent protein translocase protein TatA